jgi:hypothetical protein
VTLVAEPGSDGTHALYAFLKLAAQRYGLEVGDVHEIHGSKSWAGSLTSPEESSAD